MTSGDLAQHSKIGQDFVLENTSGSRQIFKTQTKNPFYGRIFKKKQRIAAKKQVKRVF